MPRMVWICAAFLATSAPLRAFDWIERPKDQAYIPETLSAEKQGREAIDTERGEAPETLSVETSDDLAIPIAQTGQDSPPAPLPKMDLGLDTVTEPAAQQVAEEVDVLNETIDVANPSIAGDGYFDAPMPDWTWYGRLDYLYWEATDPKRRADVFITGSTSEQSPSFNNRINLSDPNTDHEMGLRFWLGRKITDTFAMEVAGLWVYPTDYFEAFFAGVQSGGVLGGVTINTVTFAPTGEAADFANMSYRTRYWGTELNGRWLLVQGQRFDFDAVAGARYLSYVERLAFQYQFTNAASAITERFDTNNNMIGGQIGGDLRTYLCQYVALHGSSRAGLLGNFQDVDVEGPAPGTGRLTNASNLGVTSETDLSVLLEFNAGIEFLLTPDISVIMGYSGIWLNHQLRAPEQVDLNQAIPGGSPIVSLETDSIWLQGFTLALSAKW